MVTLSGLQSKNYHDLQLIQPKKMRTGSVAKQYMGLRLNLK